MRNRSGPRTDPWGTYDETSFLHVTTPSNRHFLILMIQIRVHYPENRIYGFFFGQNGMNQIMRKSMFYVGTILIALFDYYAPGCHFTIPSTRYGFKGINNNK